MFSENEFWRLVREGDSEQVDENYFLNSLPAFLDPSLSCNILDFGAGSGISKDQIKTILKGYNYKWTGIDIADSQEILLRTKNSPKIDFYDGLKLPYESNSFDVVWSHQVLEHVRYPDVSVSEISRVLRPNGLFIGAVSQLEPYHSRSIFNWTPYGICAVFDDYDLSVFELRPGVDGFIMMLRTLFGYNIGLNDFFQRESPFAILLNSLIGHSKSEHLDKTRDLKWKKISMAGHLHFAARKL